MNELVEQARFAHPRLPNDGNYLTVTTTGLLQSLAEGFDLSVSSHEAGESTSSSRLQACPHRPRTSDLVHLDRLGQPLHGHRPQRLDLKVPLGKAECFASYQGRPGTG